MHLSKKPRGFCLDPASLPVEGGEIPVLAPRRSPNSEDEVVPSIWPRIRSDADEVAMHLSARKALAPEPARRRSITSMARGSFARSVRWKGV
ncbi:MAG: hypothetical protein H6895_05490 [Defluviimonas sp.]|uniref:hypothetical protein n=1 Tax=Albidovulum sp. TaxID=1872424 RepID=UPI001D65E47A|nr:hypothetical protein [Paracoccaceae bacterium]MCC0063530.1 hypothetical protein [Defluviimonas sp.]